MSPCALKYALACSDALDPSARGACVPYGSAPTMKTHAFVRTTIQLGANGFAALLFSPSTANDVPSLYHTTTAFAGFPGGQLNPWATYGSASIAATLATGWVSAAHNGPFAYSQLTENFSNPITAVGRVVAAGARVQYTGTTLNESGIFTCYHDPTHEDISCFSGTQILAFADTNIEAVTRTPCTLNVFGVSETEMSLGPSINDPTFTTRSIYPYSQGENSWGVNLGTPFISTVGAAATYGAIAGVPVGYIGITGVANSSVQLEYIVHLEYTGRAAAAMLTKTAADLEGTNLVREAALAVPAKKLANPMKDGWQLMREALNDAWQGAKPIVVPIAKELAVAAISAAML